MVRRPIFAVAGVTLIRYYNFVRVDNISYAGFFTLSLALHLALIPLGWRKPFATNPAFEPISVSFLPAAKPAQPEKIVKAPPALPQRRREPAKTKPRKRTPIVEKNPAPARPALEIRDLPLPPQLASRSEIASPTAVEAQPQSNQAIATRGSQQGDGAIFKNDKRGEKPITRSDLLPRRHDLESNRSVIPLNTSDTRYAPYTKHVKQWIESRWEYPDLAKQYGLQGRVVVEFTILQNGQIEFLALVRSSGSKLLDEEAVRAIKAAVPFRPFPPSIRETSLRIVAGFVYSDERLLVSGTP
jgi:protein TonB